MSYTEQNWFWKKTLLRKLKSIISPNPSRTRMLLLLIGDYNGQSCQFDQIWTHLGNTLLLRKILSGCWLHASLSECWPPNLWGLFQEGCTEDSEWLEHSGNSAGKKKKRGLREKLCLLTCILSLTVSGLSCRRCYCCWGNHSLDGPQHLIWLSNAD